MNLKQFLKSFIVPHFWKKFFIMLIGILVMGFSLSFLIEVNWGTDPFTFMNRAISTTIGWSFGNWQGLLNVLMIIITIVFNWHLIGCGTIANMFLIGYTADFFCWLWEKIIPAAVFTDSSLIGIKIAVFVAALIVFIISAAVYMNADMGLSPYDAVPKIISQHLPKISYTPIRICYDMFTVLVGLFFTLKFNRSLLISLPGSAIMAICLGPAITFVGNWMKKHISAFADETAADNSAADGADKPSDSENK